MAAGSVALTRVVQMASTRPQGAQILYRASFLVTSTSLGSQNARGPVVIVVLLSAHGNWKIEDKWQCILYDCVRVHVNEHLR